MRHLYRNFFCIIALCSAALSPIYTGGDSVGGSFMRTFFGEPADKMFQASAERATSWTNTARKQAYKLPQRLEKRIEQYTALLANLAQIKSALSNVADMDLDKRPSSIPLTLDDTARSYKIRSRSDGTIALVQPITLTISILDANPESAAKSVLKVAVQTIKDVEKAEKHYEKIMTTEQKSLDEEDAFARENIRAMQGAMRKQAGAASKILHSATEALGYSVDTLIKGKADFQNKKREFELHHEQEMKKHEITLNKTLENDNKQLGTKIAARQKMVSSLLLWTPVAIGAAAGLFFLAKYWIPLLLKKQPSYMRTSIRSRFARLFKRIPPEDSRMAELQFPAELEQTIVDIFSDYRRCMNSGIELTNLMFYGPPGTGKTMAARALALELGADYILVNTPELSQLPDEEAVQAIKYIIELARRNNKPTLIFFDEADAVFMHRGSAPVKERKLTNELLSLIPEAYCKGMALIFATNLPESLDPAFGRRIGRKIYFPLPDAKTRTTLFEQYLKKFAQRCGLQIAPELANALPQIAEKLHGMSGSDIAELAHEIRLETLKEKENSINLSITQHIVTRKLAENERVNTTTYMHTTHESLQESQK